jgi:hypothetical protein
VFSDSFLFVMSSCPRCDLAKSQRGTTKQARYIGRPPWSVLSITLFCVTDLLKIEGQSQAVRTIFTILSPRFLILAPTGHRVTRGWRGARIASLGRRTQGWSTDSLGL